MTKFINKIKFYLMFGVSSLLIITFLFGGVSHAADLLWKLVSPAKYSETILDLGESAKSVGQSVFETSTDVGFGLGGVDTGSSGSIIVKATRLLLVLVIALSVTMILYNGMVYIIQTGQGKEGKSLMKNVVLIVVGIFVALFSVVIINLIQSIPTTINKELTAENNNSTDNKVLDKGKAFDL